MRGMFLGALCAVLMGCANAPATTSVERSYSLAGGCGDHDVVSARRLHIVRFNHDGVMVDPDDERVVFTREQALAHLQRMFCEAEALAQRKQERQPRLLVFVHGGLNTFGSTDKKIKDGLHQRIMSDDQDWAYPVFISWPSGALSSWNEHLFRLREGRKAHLLAGAITSPFILVSDITSSLGRFPSTVYYQGFNEVERAMSFSAWTAGAQSGAWQFAHNRMQGDVSGQRDARYAGPESGLQANLSGYYYQSWGRSAGKGAGQLVMAPFRYTIGTLAHSGISSAAWDVMKRRTQNPFYPPSDFDNRWQVVAGGMPGGRFFDALLEYVPRGETQFELTLVGHSMGTIFLNRALHEYGEALAANGMLRNIVYMAAAANIEDSLYALSPLLPRYPVNFYNLTLNRVAEVSETHYAAIAPLGSLLVSIDQHHERPEHPLRRTLGSEVNVLSSLSFIDAALAGAQGELVFRAFDAYSGRAVADQPRQHGDFSRITFWKPALWRMPPPSPELISGSPGWAD